MDKAKVLLEFGYFPSQLPPAFVTVGLANSYKEIYSKIKKHINSELNKLPSTKPVSFSIARSSFSRRQLSISNPIIQVMLSKEISDNWKEISTHFKKSKLSVSKATFSFGSDRAIKIAPISELHERRHFISSGKKFVFISDISRFFPSIYTHSIPWALHTKKTSKKKTKDMSFLGNRLDLLVRKGQDNQTIGLPIGADTSHIISEIIAISIDEKLYEHSSKKWLNGYRHVDDFYFSFQTYEEAEHALSWLVQSAKDFELEINESKTKIIPVIDEVENNWTTNIRSYSFSDNDYQAIHEELLALEDLDCDESRVKQEIYEIYNFFEMALDISRKYPNMNVLKFALKKTAVVKFSKFGWKTYEAFLIKIARIFPHLLDTICEILYTYKIRKYVIDKVKLKELISCILKDSLPLEKHGEAAWALWLAKEFEIKIPQSIANIVVRYANPICVLIFLDLKRKKLAPKNINLSQWEKFLTKDDLYGENWLLAYEAGVRGWLKAKDKNFIKNDPLFGLLEKNKVRFYDIDKKTAVFMQETEQKEINPEWIKNLDFIIDEADYLS